TIWERCPVPTQAQLSTSTIWARLLALQAFMPRSGHKATSRTWELLAGQQVKLTESITPASSLAFPIHLQGRTPSFGKTAPCRTLVFSQEIPAAAPIILMTAAWSLARPRAAEACALLSGPAQRACSRSAHF